MDNEKIYVAKQTEVNNHINDKNDPHEVTAEQTGARPNTWMPTAADVGARPSDWMPSPADIGLGNVNNTSDANKPVSNAQATAIADAKSAGTTAQSNLNTHIADKDNPHGVTAKQVSALPLDGSVPMSGSLGIANNLGGFYADINGVLVNQYETKGDLNNRRCVWIHSKHHADLANSLQFFAIENGVDKLYSIFGEHNTDLLANTIKSLIDSGVIEVGGFKSPINITSPSGGKLINRESFSGTGKGKLFVSGNSDAAEAKIEVDGVSKYVRPNSHTLEIEFNESFSVTAPNSTGSSYYIFASAVFY